MEKLTFTLKQHTPMLHFQASQQGATLRASDVKPRFDRWLVKKVWRDDFDKCKQYLVGYPGDPDESGISSKENERRQKALSTLKEKFVKSGFRALNYKMRIVDLSKGTSDYESTHILNNKGKKISAYPMYFGDEKGTILKDCQVSFVISGGVKGLYGYFCEYFSEFINCHNFGMRASKGYGSYTVVSSDSAEAKIDKFPEFNITLSGSGWKDIEKQIELFHKTIRSGINYTQVIRDKNTKCVLKDKNGNIRKKGYYFKSLLFSYVEDIDEVSRHWDKRVIKHNFLNNSRGNIKDNQDYRDCLGLSTNESWMKYNMTLTKEVSGIARYASPIIFKPVFKGNSWDVYIIINDIPKEYMGKSVKVSAKKLNKEKDTRELINDFEKKPLTMYIAKDFSIKKYFEYICSQKITCERFAIYELNENHKKEIGYIINFYQQLRNKYKKL